MTDSKDSVKAQLNTFLSDLAYICFVLHTSASFTLAIPHRVTEITYRNGTFRLSVHQDSITILFLFFSELKLENYRYLFIKKPAFYVQSSHRKGSWGTKKIFSYRQFCTFIWNLLLNDILRAERKNVMIRFKHITL